LTAEEQISDYIYNLKCRFPEGHYENHLHPLQALVSKTLWYGDFVGRHFLGLGQSRNLFVVSQNQGSDFEHVVQGVQTIYISDVLSITMCSVGIVKILIIVGNVEQLGLEGAEWKLDVSTNGLFNLQLLEFLGTNNILGFTAIALLEKVRHSWNLKSYISQR